MIQLILFTFVLPLAVVPFLVFLCGGKAPKKKGKPEKSKAEPKEEEGTQAEPSTAVEPPIETERPPEVPQETVAQPTTPVSARPDMAPGLEMTPTAGFDRGPMNLGFDPYDVGGGRGGGQGNTQMGGAGMTARGGAPRTAYGEGTTIQQPPSLALGGAAGGNRGGGGAAWQGGGWGGGGWKGNDAGGFDGGGYGGGAGGWRPHDQPNSRGGGRYPQTLQDLGGTQMGRTELGSQGLGATQRPGDPSRKQQGSIMATQAGGNTEKPNQPKPMIPQKPKGRDFGKPQERQAKAKDPTYETLKDIDVMPEQF